MRLLLIISILLVAGCSKEDPARQCVEKSKALGEVSSLANIVNNDKIAGRPTCTVYSGAQISAAQYEGQTTYFLSNAASSTAVCGFIAYDCYGEELINRASNAEAWDAYERDRTDVELLWEKP
jgi:hypothetical protein